MGRAPRKHMRSPDDYRSVVNKPAPAPVGRAAEDIVEPADVSYQPNENEKKFLEILSTLNVDSVAQAEAECIIRRSLSSFRMSSVRDRGTIVTAARKLGVTILRI